MMQIGELARRIDADYRTIRYLIERGHAGTWVGAAAGRGHHRDLSPGEAFALGLLVLIKQAGLAAPKAEQVVTFTEEGLRFLGRQLVWDPAFDPFGGALQTEHTWFGEIGELRAFRLVTNAEPGGRRRLKETDWIEISKRRRVLKGFRPVVVVRVDLARLAERLRTA